MDSEDRSTQKDTSSSAGASALSDLIARLERAAGPDRELDERIACDVLPGAANFVRGMGEEFPHFTSSIDAAMTLVPGHCEFELGSVKLLNCYYAVLTGINDEHRSIRRPTPAIALCIAALKARSQIEPLPANDSAETRLEI